MRSWRWGNWTRNVCYTGHFRAARGSAIRCGSFTHPTADRGLIADTRETIMNRLNRDQMAARVARDIPEGAYVNLGIGLPTLVANHLPKDREIFLHSENGMLAMGPAPALGEEDWDVINAGKHPSPCLPAVPSFTTPILSP